MTTHGKSKTKLYWAWEGIKQRCTNPKHLYYARYGGRGITVCDEWRNSFESFSREVGNPPSPNHSIDRIDNTKGYEPGNVRWATPEEQTINRSNTIWIDHAGKRLTLSQWADSLGISYDVLNGRVQRGESIEDILKPRKNQKRNSIITFDGKAMSFKEWSVTTGIKYETLIWRWKRSKKLF